MADIEHDDGSVTVELEEEQAGPGEQGQPQQREPAQQAQPNGASDDEHDDEDDEGQEDGQRAEGEQQGAAGEHPSKTELNRQRRQQRKEARREREAEYQRQLQARDAVINQLNERLSLVERRSSGTELATLDGKLRQLADAHEYFKGQIAIATEAKDGASVADATEKMLAARQQHAELVRVRQAYTQNQQAPQPMDPRVMQQAQQWTARNKWYNPAGTDLDSRLVLQLDSDLAQQGFNPTTPEYWTELDKRVQKYLPHRAVMQHNREQDQELGGQQQQGRPPKSVIPGSNRESGNRNGSRQGGYTVSPDRVAAMKEAGVWDDPKKRNEAIKRFREYDKTHGLTN